MTGKFVNRPYPTRLVLSHSHANCKIMEPIFHISHISFNLQLVITQFQIYYQQFWFMSVFCCVDSFTKFQNNVDSARLDNTEDSWCCQVSRVKIFARKRPFWTGNHFSSKLTSVPLLPYVKVCGPSFHVYNVITCWIIYIRIKNVINFDRSREFDESTHHFHVFCLLKTWKCRSLNVTVS